MVRQRAHRSEGLRGPSSGSTRDKTKIVFFEPEIWTIPTCSRRSRARIDPFAFSPLAAWEHKRIRFNGNISTVRFISTTEHRIARTTLERARARASSYERAAELETSFRFLFSCCQVRIPSKKKKKHNTITVLLLLLTTKKQYHTALNPTNPNLQQ